MIFIIDLDNTGNTDLYVDHIERLGLFVGQCTRKVVQHTADLGRSNQQLVLWAPLERSVRITGLDHSKPVTVQHTADSADNSSHIVNIEGHSRPTDSADIVATAATIAALTKDHRSFKRRAARLAAEPKVRQVHRVEAHSE